MKTSYLSILLALLVSTPAIAEKPAWAGKEKVAAEQKEAQQAGMETKEKAGEKAEEDFGHQCRRK